MINHLMKLLEKSVQIERMAAGGMPEIGREEVLQAMAGLTKLQTACLYARYLGKERDNAESIVSELYNRILPKFVKREQLEQWGTYEQTLVSRAAWLVFQRYYSGDHCPKCNGSGAMPSAVSISADGRKVILPPRLCQRCKGLGVSVTSERNQADTVGVTRAVFLRVWKPIIDSELTHLRTIEVAASDYIRKGLRSFYVQSSDGRDRTDEPDGIRLGTQLAVFKPEVMKA